MRSYEIKSYFFFHLILNVFSFFKFSSLLWKFMKYQRTMSRIIWRISQNLTIDFEGQKYSFLSTFCFLLRLFILSWTLRLMKKEILLLRLLILYQLNFCNRYINTPQSISSFFKIQSCVYFDIKFLHFHVNE
jgi:hypothetical protein